MKITRFEIASIRVLFLVKTPFAKKLHGHDGTRSHKHHHHNDLQEVIEKERQETLQNERYFAVWPKVFTFVKYNILMALYESDKLSSYCFKC